MTDQLKNWSNVSDTHMNAHVNHVWAISKCMKLIIWATTWENWIFHIRKQRHRPAFRLTAKLISALCFRYTASTIPPFLNTKFQASSHLVWLYSLVCVGPGRKPQRPFFSEWGSFDLLCIKSGCIVFILTIHLISLVFKPFSAYMCFFGSDRGQHKLFALQKTL